LDIDTHPLLADLTTPQRQAVMHTEGPLLVLAAAGSGKTRVITRRLAWLVLECGVPPWSVLSITFTNKAAGEMRQRVAALLSERQAGAVSVGTFHALCARLLRKYPEAAGVKPDFVIFDTSDQKRALKTAYKELDISTQNFAPDQVLSTISDCKNRLIDAEGYAAGATDFFGRTAARLFRRYQELLARSGALDFDDLLLKTARMLRSSEPVRTELQERYQYVQIDEYQDTNHAQFVIAHTLAAAHKNLCVVGDPDQSIYGWRGADLRNILDFEQHYGQGAKVIALGQNYRSTPEILKTADTLIRHNVQRRHKELFTENQPGPMPVLIQASSEAHEAEIVLDALMRHHEDGVPWGQMAVFYRINALSRAIEEEMLRRSVPYLVVRGTAFYQRAEIKDALAYLRLVVNPDDEISLDRVINTPARGIGDTSMQHLAAFATANGLSLWGALDRVPEIGAIATRTASAMTRFVRMIDQWREKAQRYDTVALGFEPGVRDVVEMIIRESGLEAFYQHEKTADEEKLANLYELVTAAARFDEEDAAEEYVGDEATLEAKLRRYLERVALVSDVDALQDAGGAVTLMTLHAAKGLEFPVVAIVGLEEGLLPHTRSQGSPDELEEERRLAFVGITRAQRHLMMTHARYRTIRGMRERTIPSPFIREMGTTITIEDRSGFDVPSWGDEGEEDGPAVATGRMSGASPYRVGALVRHPQFGMGRLLSLVPAHAPSKAKVQFERSGVKTLVLEYARLELVGE
jgi:DNA helicase-2/ATP-dependent DNA helicase PcrA